MEPLGERIKELRRQRSLTLRDLRARTGFSISFLSQVERGRSSLSISSLRAIGDALGVHLSYFFPPPPAADHAIRVRDRRPFRLEGSPIRYTRLSGDVLGGTLDPLIVTIPPRFRPPEPFAHPGEEFAYILKGTLTMRIDTKTYVLRPGDAIHFSARTRHTWENRGRRSVVALWVNTPKLF